MLGNGGNFLPAFGPSSKDEAVDGAIHWHNVVIFDMLCGVLIITLSWNLVLVVLSLLALPKM